MKEIKASYGIPSAWNRKPIESKKIKINKKQKKHVFEKGCVVSLKKLEYNTIQEILNKKEYIKDCKINSIKVLNGIRVGYITKDGKKLKVREVSQKLKVWEVI